MKYQILLLSLLAVVHTATGQTAERQVIGAGGNSYSGSAVQLDYTIGEAVVASGTAGTFSIAQGFQQNPESSTGIEENKFLAKYSLYPNPAQNQIVLSLQTSVPFNLKITLSNCIGQILLADNKPNKVNNSYQRAIDINALASGIYSLNLYTEQNILLQSIQFQKQ